MKGAEITPEALARFARPATEGLGREDGRFRRNHVEKLVQRAKVRPTGAKSWARDRSSMGRRKSSDAEYHGARSSWCDRKGRQAVKVALASFHVLL